MIVKDDFKVALANLLANKMRSLFSMLGVVIGTGSVILVISVVNGTREKAIRDNQAGNEGLLRVMATYDEKSERLGEIGMQDLDAIRQLPGVSGAFPVITASNVDARGTQGRMQVNLSAVDFFYKDLYQLQMLEGRFTDRKESADRLPVCMISDVVARTLFGYESAVGQRLRMQAATLEVIGVFKSSEKTGARIYEAGNVLLPYNTMFNLMSRPKFWTVRVQSEDGKIDAAKAQLAAWRLRLTRPTDVEIKDPRDSQKDIEKWARIWLLQMTVVASISLFVGGIGLMNVMLTTVAERTHEIGLRKALGADSRSILSQFLVESAMLSTVGGMLGVLLGVLLSYAVEVMSKGRLTVSILPMSLFGSLGFSIVTGVIFGLYPASSAARLSPVEALHFQ